MPAWMYWEGPQPDWIAACRAKTQSVLPLQFVSKERWYDELWQEDKDINIERLRVEHRHDFIVAYLLAHHGGSIWQTDCVVTRSPQTFLAECAAQPFVGYREKDGNIANCPMGACVGSPIAMAYYKKVCTIVRRGNTLAWLEIGGLALTETVHEAHMSWAQYPTETFEPIWWPDVKQYYVKRTPQEHEAVVEPNAIAYNVFGSAIRKHEQNQTVDHRNDRLMDDGTFFRYILERPVAT